MGGLVFHIFIYGTLLAAFAPLFASGRALTVGAVVFGLLLYLVNFQILGRIAFEWFQEGPNQTFEVFAHAGYGLLLAPFLTGYAGGMERVGAGVRAKPQRVDA